MKKKRQPHWKQRPRNWLVLYHGTSAANAHKITKEGLLPRCVHGGPSNFEGKIESKPEYVYLTDAWPVFYGFNSSETSDFVVFQVLVYEDELLPDEDFLALVAEQEDRKERKRKLREDMDIEGSRPTKTQQDFIAECHPSQRPELALHSLHHLGTVACKAVPPDRIMGHCVLPKSDFLYLCALGADSNPTANALIPALREHCRDRYSENLRKLFDIGWVELKRLLDQEAEERQAQFEKLRDEREKNRVAEKAEADGQDQGDES